MYILIAKITSGIGSTQQFLCSCHSQLTIDLRNSKRTGKSFYVPAICLCCRSVGPEKFSN